MAHAISELQPEVILDQAPLFRTSIGMRALARLLGAVPSHIPFTGGLDSTVQTCPPIICCCAFIAMTSPAATSCDRSLQTTLARAAAWYDATIPQVQLMGSSIGHGMHPGAIILSEGLRHGMLQSLIQQLAASCWLGTLLITGRCRDDENLLSRSTALAALMAVGGPFCIKGCSMILLSQAQWSVNVSDDDQGFPAPCRLIVCTVEPRSWVTGPNTALGENIRIFGPRAAHCIAIQAEEPLRKAVIQELRAAGPNCKLLEHIWNCQRSPARLHDIQLFTFTITFTRRATEQGLKAILKWAHKLTANTNGHCALLIARLFESDDPVCALMISDHVLEAMIVVNAGFAGIEQSQSIALQMGIRLATHSPATAWAQAGLQYTIEPHTSHSDPHKHTTDQHCYNNKSSSDPLATLCGAAKPFRQTSMHYGDSSTAMIRASLLTMPQAFQVEGPHIVDLHKWDECLQAIAGRQPQCNYASGSIRGAQATNIVLFLVDPAQAQAILGRMIHGRTTIKSVLGTTEVLLTIREYYGPAVHKETDLIGAMPPWQGPLFAALTALGADAPTSCTLPVRIWVQSNAKTFTEPKPTPTACHAATTISAMGNDDLSHMLPCRTGPGATATHGITLDPRRTFGVAAYAWRISLAAGQHCCRNHEAALQAAVVAFSCLPAQWTGSSMTGPTLTFRRYLGDLSCNTVIGMESAELTQCHAIIIIHDAADGAGFAICRKKKRLGEILCQSNGTTAFII